MGTPKGFLDAVGTSHSVSTWLDHTDHQKVNRSFKILKNHPAKDRQSPDVTRLFAHTAQLAPAEFLWGEKPSEP